jgi:hypothetical protein
MRRQEPFAASGTGIVLRTRGGEVTAREDRGRSDTQPGLCEGSADGTPARNLRSGPSAETGYAGPLVPIAFARASGSTHARCNIGWSERRGWCPTARLRLPSQLHADGMAVCSPPGPPAACEHNARARQASKAPPPLGPTSPQAASAAAVWRSSGTYSSGGRKVTQLSESTSRFIDQRPAAGTSGSVSIGQFERPHNPR